MFTVLNEWLETSNLENSENYADFFNLPSLSYIIEGHFISEETSNPVFLCPIFSISFISSFKRPISYWETIRGLKRGSTKEVYESEDKPRV